MLALGVKVDLAFLIKNSFLDVLEAAIELVLVDEQFWRPGRRHVKDLFGSLFLIRRIVITLILIVIIVSGLILGLYHDEFPVGIAVFLEVHIDLADGFGRVQVDPEVLVVKDRLD